MDEHRIDTQLIAVDPTAPDPAVMARAAAVIRRGGLVAFPTETVYGLGADALNGDAVARIFAAKERPAYDPIIVHVADPTDLTRLAAPIPSLAWELAARFWPGALTLVLPRTDRVPDVITAGGPTVAVRCPNHPLAQALIRAAGTPIGAPSANRFSRTSPTTAHHVWSDLAGRIDMILDGGPTTIGVESTVLDVSGDAPVLLRPGGVPVEELEAAIGRPLMMPRRAGAGTQLASPGMLDRHYAPRARLHLFRGAPEVVTPAMLAEARAAKDAGEAVACLVAEEEHQAFAAVGVPVSVVGPRTRPDQVARRLFAAMRNLDDQGVVVILAHDFPPVGLGLAINDRLRRAAQTVTDVTAA